MQSDQSERRHRTSSEQYARARELAKERRATLGICTKDISIPLLKNICKHEGIKVDLVEKLGSRIRAAYFFDEDGASILLRKDLPRAPKLFSLAHELKHHYLDRVLIAQGKITCGDYNQNKAIEIAAEVFAAEFIYPEEEMRTLVASFGIKAGLYTAEDIVRIKRQCPVTVSYLFVQKRLRRFDFTEEGQFAGVQFRNLEEAMFPPLHKQEWFRKARARKQRSV